MVRVVHIILHHPAAFVEVFCRQVFIDVDGTLGYRLPLARKDGLDVESGGLVVPPSNGAEGPRIGRGAHGGEGAKSGVWDVSATSICFMELSSARKFTLFPLPTTAG